MATDSGSDSRQSFQEIMELVELSCSDPAGGVRRYTSRRNGWVPGSDIGNIEELSGPGKTLPYIPGRCYGGQVYSQSGFAASLAVEDEEKKKGLPGGQQARFGLHTMHGYFCSPGLVDRPFIYEVKPVSQNRSFITRLVTVRQPKDRSASWTEGRPFPPSDAAAEPGPVCFTALVSFKLPEPDSDGVSAGEPPPQARFADLLESRPPWAWPPSPPIDLDGVTSVVGTELVGTFPAVELRKVDMSAHNAGRPLHKKRELILYRILRPLPAGPGAGGENAHVLLHAYEADRNGLLMAANFLGFGRGIRQASSLSYSFVVHTNADAAVMRHAGEFSKDGGGGGGRQEDKTMSSVWWVQEVSFPRAAAGRAMIESKIWSPEGVHVATEYQDGLCTVQPGMREPGKEKEKL